MAQETKFTITIVQSVINVECVVPSYDPLGDSSLLFIRALQFARAVVDCLAFQWGQGLTVILDDLVAPDGTKHIIFANGDLAKLATAFAIKEVGGSSSDFLSMFNVVVAHPELFLALNDLIVAISAPGYVAINCARAIEGLRSALLPSGENRTRAWEVFRHVLNLDKPYLEYITDASTKPRHGDKYEGPTEDNGELLRRSWIIMNRFLEFKKRGCMPLSIIDFPIL